jgi:hypothetical protein
VLTSTTAEEDMIGVVDDGVGDDGFETANIVAAGRAGDERKAVEVMDVCEACLRVY